MVSPSKERENVHMLVNVERIRLLCKVIHAHRTAHLGCFVFWFADKSLAEQHRDGVRVEGRPSQSQSHPPADMIPPSSSLRRRLAKLEDVGDTAVLGFTLGKND
jgi:hypothetical protein